jgi:hypothetical protein
MILPQFLLLFYTTVTTIHPNAIDRSVDRSSLLQTEIATNNSQKSSIGGIRFMMTERQVKQILGQPIERIVGHECGTEEIVDLNYKDIRIGLYKHGTKFLVYRVETNSSRYRTDRNIRVGSSIDRAKAAYPSLILNKYSHFPSWRSYNSHFDIDLNDRGKIVKIYLGINTGC